MNIALFYGGQSGEHEISCISASFLEKTISSAGHTVIPVYIDKSGVWHRQNKVYKNSGENTDNPAVLAKNSKEVILSDQRYGSVPINFAFPIIHGTTGEDGAIQGLFEVFELPYSGCNVSASAVGMDKVLSRIVFEKAGLKQVNYAGYNRWEHHDSRQLARIIIDRFKLPVFAKPCNLGSSVGISKVKNESELVAAIDLAFSYDENIIIEEGRNIRELELAILGNYPNYETSIVGEITPNHEFYSYSAKYLDDNGATLEIPANLSEEQNRQMADLACRAFAALRGDGYARVDFFLDRDTGDFLINEINTLPGFTPISMFPSLWEKSGQPPVATVTKIIELGLERSAARKKLNRNRE